MNKCFILNYRLTKGTNYQINYKEKEMNNITRSYTVKAMIVENGNCMESIVSLMHVTKYPLPRAKK